MDIDTFSYVSNYMDMTKLREILYSNNCLGTCVPKIVMARMYMINNGHDELIEVIMEDPSIYRWCIKLGMSKKIMANLIIRNKGQEIAEKYLIPEKISPIKISKSVKHLIDFYVYEIYLKGDNAYKPDILRLRNKSPESWDYKVSNGIDGLMWKSIWYRAEIICFLVKIIPDQLSSFVLGHIKCKKVPYQVLQGLLKGAILYKNKKIYNQAIALIEIGDIKLKHILSLTQIKNTVNSPLDINRVLLSENDYIYWWICCYKYNPNVFYSTRKIIKNRILKEGVNYSRIVKYIISILHSPSDNELEASPTQDRNRDEDDSGDENTNPFGDDTIYDNIDEYDLTEIVV
jgi:hypothetical protein